MKIISFINLLVVSFVFTLDTRVVSFVVTSDTRVVSFVVTSDTRFHKNHLTTLNSIKKLNLVRIQEIKRIGYPLNFRSATAENLLYHYNPIMNKTKEIIKLTRLENNLIPTSILTLIGGFVTNPSSWKVWIYSPAFLAGYSMVIIMTATSMIINDIYDIDIDKINNPNRPLVKGTVTLFEAKTLIIILLGIYSYLGIKYLPPILNKFWMISILLTVLYTPILKKICFIKNLTCASIVSSTIPFIGLTTLASRVTMKDATLVTKKDATILPDFYLMFITSKIIFVCSLYIEILLDICDKEGDAKANINTIPVLFGKDKAIYILKLILLFSNINFLYDIIKLNNPILFIGTMLSFSLCYLNLINIKNNNYSKLSIIKALKETTNSLIFFFLIILYKNKLHLN